ncbi:hypothetical protein GCM10023144_26560 [Pigmentiphaga soli]|uniref:Uncharacterized protein n=1 Tax=Pigmentiphaga soli TaxID=1007095 RepID=A0ABP8H4Q4_9BURK
MRDGIDTRRVARLGLAALVVLAAAVAAALWLASHWTDPWPPLPQGPDGTPAAAAGQGRQPGASAEPALEAHPQQALADYLREKARLTDRYGWLDRRAGIARIPVDEAMRALAERAGDPAATEATP